MVRDVTATTFRWHFPVALLYTNEYYFKLTHTYCVVKYKWILLIVNTKLYSRKVKATCCGWTYWLSSDLITRIEEGMYFATVFQVRGLNHQKQQYTYSVEDIGCLKLITLNLILLYTYFSTLWWSNWNIHTSILRNVYLIAYVMLFFLSKFLTLYNYTFHAFYSSVLSLLIAVFIRNSYCLKDHSAMPAIIWHYYVYPCVRSISFFHP